MKDAWEEKVVALHPAIVTGLFLILFFGGGAAVNLIGFETWAPAMALMIAQIIVWHYSLYRAASKRFAALNGSPPRISYTFLMLAISMPALLTAAGLAMTSGLRIPAAEKFFTILMVAACLSYFAAIWVAARGLCKLELRSVAPPVHSVLGTFLLEFYLPIGIWFLHGRIQKALAR